MVEILLIDTTLGIPCNFLCFPSSSRQLNAFVGPWLWKEANNEEEKVKNELRGRHSDCHWVEVSKRT
jgi:hypothetical protein